MNGLFYLEKNDGQSLQDQIYGLFIRRLFHKQLLPGQELPSTRVLAKHLKVSRNTVLAAYEKLMDYGYVSSHPRRGYFFNDPLPFISEIDWSRKRPDDNNTLKENQQKPDLPINYIVNRHRLLSKPQSWRDFKYPFICGQVDENLFMHQEWQECCRILNHKSFLNQWIDDKIDQDDTALIEAIHQQVLPKRGIQCGPECILVTQGSQQSLYILAQLLMKPGLTLALETPCYPDAYQLFEYYGVRLCRVPVQDQSIKNYHWPKADFYYVMPSHQCPTQRTMSLEERRNLLDHCYGKHRWIIEDDYDYELNFNHQPLPAIKAMDTENAVLYLGSFSKIVAPGLRLGFMVVPETLVNEARVLRRMMMRHPCGYLQRAVALFIKRGYYDQQINCLLNAYADRYRCLMSRLEQFNLPLHISPLSGGSSIWVKFQTSEFKSKSIHAPVRVLLSRASEAGVYFEPGDVFYTGLEIEKNFTARFGFSAINKACIQEGLVQLEPILNQWCLEYL